MIPPTSRGAIEQAMADFDASLRDLPAWQGWENNRAHKYAIAHNGQRYPVKQIVSLATGMSPSEFNGGVGAGQANEAVTKHGFKVVQLRTRNPVWSRDELILALDLYLQHRHSPPGKEREEIRELSDTLNRLAVVTRVNRQGDFRNPNGVYMKLMNYRSLDPEYTGQGKVGMTRRGKGDEAA